MEAGQRRAPARAKTAAAGMWWWWWGMGWGRALELTSASSSLQNTTSTAPLSRIERRTGRKLRHARGGQRGASVGLHAGWLSGRRPQASSKREGEWRAGETSEATAATSERRRDAGTSAARGTQHGEKGASPANDLEACQVQGYPCACALRQSHAPLQQARVVQAVCGVAQPVAQQGQRRGQRCMPGTAGRPRTQQLSSSAARRTSPPPPPSHALRKAHCAPSKHSWPSSAGSSFGQPSRQVRMVRCVTAALAQGQVIGQARSWGGVRTVAAAFPPRSTSSCTSAGQLRVCVLLLTPAPLPPTCPPQDRMQERPVGPGLVATREQSTPARFMLLVNRVPHCSRGRTWRAGGEGCWGGRWHVLH